jgi:hypothetical protein
MASRDSRLEELVNACTAHSGDIKAALSWVSDPENAERIQPNRPALEKELRRAAFQARKLEQTVANSMCVGVFGPSQAGKSYLVSVLASKGGKLTAVFDGGKTEADFLREINPGGGEESTGLVTRFTIHDAPTPPGFPVSVRLLTQTDLAKILANTYCNETKHEYETALDNLDGFIASYEASMSTDYTDTLREEDVWDLQDYFERYLQRFESARAIGPFWERLARVAPRLPVDKRAELYSIFWNRHEPLTTLYTNLTQVLASLGFPEQAYCQLEALVPSDKSIINVKSLESLVVSNDERARILTKSGASGDISKAILTALIAELRIVVKEQPWEFFEYTDLLDFPGYRSREQLELKKAFAERLEKTVAEMFLRGKVDFLFQRYTAEQELTSMLLCLEDSNLEVKSLVPAVEDWVNVTHGKNAAERTGKPKLLFLCFTKFDRQLTDKAGDVGNDSARFDTRVNASLLNAFRNSAWPTDWARGSAFNNSYLIRNPKFGGAAHIFESQPDFHELAIRPQANERLAQLKSAFLSVDKIKRHFREPEKAWEAVLKLNDGGISYLAENLAQVCLPNVKPDQIRSRLSSVRGTILTSLQRYYDDSDVATRLKKRNETLDEIIKEVEGCIERQRFGTLLAGLCIDRVELSDALHTARRAMAETATPVGRSSILGRSKRGQGRSGTTIDFPIANPARGNAALGNAAVEAWATHMRAMVESPGFARAVGLSSETIAEIVSEISMAAKRRNLADQIAKALDSVRHIEANDTIIAKATIIALHMVNGFVAKLGYDRVPPAERATVQDAEGNKHPVFMPPDTVHDASGIGAERPDFGVHYALNWWEAFDATVHDNTTGGSTQNPEQNEKLGKILERLRA